MMSRRSIILILFTLCELYELVHSDVTDTTTTTTTSFVVSSTESAKESTASSYNDDNDDNDDNDHIANLPSSRSFDSFRFYFPRRDWQTLPRFGGGQQYWGRRHFTTTSNTTQTPIQSTVQNTSILKWLEDLRKNNESITTLQGLFRLGQSADVTISPDCPKTPLNGTGVCTIISDCPEVFPFLTNINVYLQYFCPLNEYAGVCCPKKQGTTINP